jgi:GNAT superfamily N-acetyltransferase
MTNFHIRPFLPDDLPLGLRLKSEAGWNQTEVDWQRAVALEPAGCFVAELTEPGQPPRGAGTATTCIFGDVAWIAMVLVDAKLRGQGIGRALMQHALAWLDARGVPTIRLDATPLGQPLYETLGFTVDFALARYEGRPQTDSQSSHHAPRDAGLRIEPLQPTDLPSIFEIDRQITQTDRSKLLRALFSENPTFARVAWRENRIVSFVTNRPGARATHIGPCLAIDNSGEALLADALEGHKHETAFVDIPDANCPAVDLAVTHGLKVQRPLMRMTRGRKIDEQPTGIWASFGPEKG